MKKNFEEFKKFISKGNIVDLSVAVIIGGAFGKIVSSVVNDILMPLLGIILGGLDFTSLSITLGDARIMYGSFIQNVIDFLIIAVCIFIISKILYKIIPKKKEEAPKPPKGEDIILLEEIRDLLKEKNKKK